MGTVLMVLVAWLFVSAITAAVCCLLVRGGQEADRVVRSAPAPLVPAGRRSAPSPRRPLEGMAEFSG